MVCQAVEQDQCAFSFEQEISVTVWNRFGYEVSYLDDSEWRLLLAVINVLTNRCGQLGDAIAAAFVAIVEYDGGAAEFGLPEDYAEIPWNLL